MYVMCVGGQNAAKERLRRAGWVPGQIAIGPRATISVMAKNGAIVAFEPCDNDSGCASLPGVFSFGFTPLPEAHPLYREAMDCLCLIDLTKGDSNGNNERKL